MALISPHTIYVANCGDSRTMVVCRDGRLEHTRDHKPGLPHEHQRILEAGYTVTNGRVEGQLAVSRALGDFQYKV